MDENRKYSVIGKVVEKLVSINGYERIVFHDFNRIDYAPDVESVIEVVTEKLKKKYSGGRFYEVVDFAVLQIDVYELKCERYDWDAHRRFNLEYKEEDWE